MNKRITLQPAFILHRRPYRDTSWLLECVTQDHGLISAVARGARGSRSRYSAQLQPFTPLLISWTGKQALVTLTQAEMDGPMYQLQGNTLFSAFYLNELLLRSLQHRDSHPKIYHAYKKALEQLPVSLTQTLRLFEKQLLNELGYGLQFHREAMTECDIVPTKQYMLETQKGFVAAPHDSLKPNPNRLSFSGKSLLALHKECFDDKEDLRAAKQIMHLALKSLIGEKTLKTRTIFAQCQQLTVPTDVRQIKENQS